MITPTLRQMAMVLAAVSLCAPGCATHSHAGPPQFPDLARYTPVNATDYLIALPSPGRAVSNQTYFLTPDGITCGFLSESAGCTGNNFPNIPPLAADPASGAEGENSIATDSGLSTTNAPIASDGKVQGHQIKTLPPLHSITVNGVICGVDDAHTAACKDAQGRGFVLSPHGSAWLPHV
jgi:hypothetical protein